MEKSRDTEQNQLYLEKNMQEFEPSSTCLTNDFIGFENDQQEYFKISEKFRNLKNLIEILNTRSTNYGSDNELSTNIGKNYNLIGIGISQYENANGKICSPAKMIRCKSINDLLENSNDDRNHVLSESHPAPNLSPKFSQNKDSQVMYKTFHNSTVPKNDKIIVTSSGKSAASFTITNQKLTQNNSNFNHSTMTPKLLNCDSQVPQLPISSSIYSNHSISAIYPSPYMFNAMPSCSNYMQRGMKASIGINSLRVPIPQRFQPPSSFVLDNFNSPITFPQFPNVYSYIRNKQPILTSDSPRYSYERAQNGTCSSIGSTPNEATIVCIYCTFTFVNKELFNEHLHAGLCTGLTAKKGTNGKAVTSEYYQEKENDNKQVVYACHICEKSFDEKDELNSHEMDKHNLLSSHEKTLKKIDNLHSKRFSCTICHKHFILSKKLFLHLKEFHNITFLKDCIPEHSFYLQNNNAHNDSYSSIMPQNDNLSQIMLKSKSHKPKSKEGTPIISSNVCIIDNASMNHAQSGNPKFATCVSSKTSTVQVNCLRHIDDSSDKPKASTTPSNSLSTISTSSYDITTNNYFRQISKCSSPTTTSSTISTTSSRMSTTSNANEFSSHEIKQANGEGKAASNVADSESITGSSINCPGCSFTFMGDNLFAQHLKAGLCSKLLTDTISKKFPGYTVCNIKRKEQNRSVEDQNVSLKKNNDKYHKFYMCELCTDKFTTKEMLLSHRKSSHKVSNLHPVPTMLTEIYIQNQIDGEVTNDVLLNQTNHYNTQTSTSTPEVLTASQSDNLHNVSSKNTNLLSNVKQISGSNDTNIRTQTNSHLESNMNDSINFVSNPTSSVESSRDMSKNSETCKSHDLELEVKRMELSAWKSWKEACDLQMQFWKNKLASLEEDKSSRNSPEIEHTIASNNFTELNGVYIKQEEENHC